MSWWQSLCYLVPSQKELQNEQTKTILYLNDCRKIWKKTFVFDRKVNRLTFSEVNKFINGHGLTKLTLFINLPITVRSIGAWEWNWYMLKNMYVRHLQMLACGCYSLKRNWLKEPISLFIMWTTIILVKSTNNLVFLTNFIVEPILSLVHPTQSLFHLNHNLIGLTMDEL